MSEKEQPNKSNFTGFPSYENSYDYDSAKTALVNAMDELRTNKTLMNDLGMNSDSGRGMITGKSETVVWDYLSMGYIEKGIDPKTHLHLTLGINDKNVEATITIPDNINKYQEDKIKKLGMPDFKNCCEKILDNMKPILKENSGAQPILRGLQRRYYPSQGSFPTMDTIIEADIRTAFKRNLGGEYPKNQDQWLRVIYAVFCQKEPDVNYQMQIGMYFSYEKCRKIQNPDALKFIIASWLACKPLIDACK